MWRCGSSNSPRTSCAASRRSQSGRSASGYAPEVVARRSRRKGDVRLGFRAWTERIRHRRNNHVFCVRASRENQSRDGCQMFHLAILYHNFTYCTRPRPAGVNGILQFLFLRVRGRTRVRSRELPANHQMTYPPASRGREWNFTIPLSPRAGTHAGTVQRTTSESPDDVPARVPRA